MKGVGVFLAMIGGKSSADAYKSSVGKTIASIAMRNEDDTLCFAFSDGTGLEVRDEGQSCCEHRYMRTDDDLTSHVGATLVGMELRDAPNEPDEYGDHEIQFLIVNTSAGSFTCASHNEHNGYYGGFAVQCKAVDAS